MGNAGSGILVSFAGDWGGGGGGGEEGGGKEGLDQSAHSRCLARNLLSVYTVE